MKAKKNDHGNHNRTQEDLDDVVVEDLLVGV